MSPTAMVRMFGAKLNQLPTAPSHPFWAWVAPQLATAPQAKTPRIALHSTPTGTWLALVCANRPFVPETILMVLRAHNAEPTAYSHMAMAPTRTGKVLTAATPATRTTKGPESWFVGLLPALNTAQQEALKQALHRHLALTFMAVADFPAMLTSLNHTTQTVLGSAALAEEHHFCQWLAEGHFVLLGYQTEPAAKAKSTLKDATPKALGILNPAGGLALPPLGQASKKSPAAPLILTKTPLTAPVHRMAPMDEIRLTERNAKGEAVQTHRFVGLYTSSAYTEGVRTTPLLRKKLGAIAARVRRQQRWAETSYHGRILLNVLETWPRDELLLATEEALAPLVAAAVGLRTRPNTCLLLRCAPQERAAIALVYLPLARITTPLRTRIAALLAQHIGPVRTYHIELGDEGHAESGLSRMVFRCDWDGHALDEAQLNQSIRTMVRGWDDEVREALGALPAWLNESHAAYRAQTTPTQAVADARIVADLQGPCATVHPAPNTLSLRFYSPQPLPLARTVMLLERCGLNPTHEEAHVLGNAHLHALHVGLQAPLTPAQTEALSATLNACLRGEAEEDSLNRLALLIHATPAELTLARAWAAYAQQLHRVLEPHRTRHALWGQPALTRDLLDLFHARHQPHAKAALRNRAKALQTGLEQAIANLPTTEEEHLWRTLLGIVLATLRTNHYVRPATEALAFKVNPALIPQLAEPLPWREIFVYHPAIEGVHLRGGPIARGGLRHSSRGTDYRTEVLGLMTAQMRKNTIIVPVGAKGGFYLRQNAPAGTSPKEWVITNYRRYIRALLSLTDNRTAKGEAVAPTGLRCHDGADTYLVVAADKGTATFSDFANAESQAADYWGPAHKGFWLDDAFASGGKTGYDHKALGITARGAWISVLHHAGALGITPSAKRPLRMAGIGDMAGDVFGNGLLQSPHVHLVAAFNHSHIFIDPNPNAAQSFAERERCFKAGLAWEAYAPQSLSKGGGIYPRNAKQINLAPEAQQALGIKTKTLTPDALIQAILAAPLDALWNGGIGTYIKATNEPHSAAQDKTNDTTRIDAKAFRAKIIGEGGNLGVTPRARVELALRGVRLNTDALDNSAGVDTSDHEVNLKILCALAERQKLITRAARNTLLAKLTPEISAQVLRDNSAQNLLLALETAAPTDDHAELTSWQETLVRLGLADTGLDCLPSRKEVLAREDARYTRPELAALVAASKAWLKRELLADTTLLHSPAAAPLLHGYFPKALREKLEPIIPQHPLAEELTATILANLIINRLGVLAVPRLMADFGTTATDAARALAAACCLARLTPLWAQLDALQSAPTPLNTPAQMAAYGRLKLVGNFMGAWVLRQGQPVVLEKLWATYLTPMEEAITLLPKVLGSLPEVATRTREWEGLGLPTALASRMALLSPTAALPDAVLAAKTLRQPLGKVLPVHLQVGRSLMLPPLINQIRAMPSPDAFTRRAIQALVLEICFRQRRLTESLLKIGQSVEERLHHCGTACGTYQQFVRQLLKEKQLTVAMLTLLLGKMRELEG